MSKVHEEIDDGLRSFIGAQHMFFVATAPLDAGGHVNLSPKGLDTLRIIDARTLAYLDYVGSGAETIAHVRENARIVIMLCAFEGPPKIVRFHGRGEVIEPADVEYAALRGLFPADPPDRAIIRISVQRIADSCGFGVPQYAYDGPRSQLLDWSERKGAQGLGEYQRQKNRISVDGLPALRWVEQPEDELDPTRSSS
jgi:hypothetical protein